MNKSRLEAFSDGVLAIVITIMVLALSAPNAVTWEALRPSVPVFVSYLISFVYVGIYWVNHHHLMHVTHHVTNKILWANLNLLFWISLIPFSTSWVGTFYTSPIPVAFYGGILFMCGIAFRLFEVSLIYADKSCVEGAKIRRLRKKEVYSLVIYLLAIPLSFLSVWIAIACYAFVPCWWLLPDLHVERADEE